MNKEEIEQFYPKTKQHWRKWLEKNHSRKDAVWLIFYRKSSGKASLATSDAVDCALCYGWIDSRADPLDSERYKHYFSKRKPGSTWSKINKQKIQTLTEEGLVTEAGFKSIEVAKQNGSWTLLDEVEELIIPKDLMAALRAKLHKKFIELSKSKRKLMLQSLALAKTKETRKARIKSILDILKRQ
jgi:uncharacterized protein YdeI (YjbR/CyaY-like superfamily)